MVEETYATVEQHEVSPCEARLEAEGLVPQHPQGGGHPPSA